MRVSNAARLTDDELDSIPGIWGGSHRRDPRDIADAATAKATAYWQGRVRELVVVTEHILTLNLLDGFRERQLSAALTLFREEAHNET